MAEAVQPSQDPTLEDNEGELLNERDSKDFNWLAGAFRGKSSPLNMLMGHQAAWQLNCRLEVLTLS